MGAGWGLCALTPSALCSACPLWRRNRRWQYSSWQSASREEVWTRLSCCRLRRLPGQHWVCVEGGRMQLLCWGACAGSSVGSPGSPWPGSRWRSLSGAVCSFRPRYTKLRGKAWWPKPSHLLWSLSEPSGTLVFLLLQRAQLGPPSCAACQLQCLSCSPFHSYKAQMLCQTNDLPTVRPQPFSSAQLSSHGGKWHFSLNLIVWGAQIEY